jgi:hypothetical protein
MNTISDERAATDTISKAPKRIGNPLAALVSIYPNARNTTPLGTRNLADVLADIRGGKFKDQVEKLRRLRSQDRDQYDARKKYLRAFTMSGISERQKPSRVTAHSNILQLDFDNLGRKLKHTRAQLENDAHVLFVFLSPSGDGLKAGLLIDGNRHHESFLGAESYFQNRYGLSIDSSVKDPARLCFVSHDPLLAVNKLATPFAARIENRKIENFSSDFIDTVSTDSKPNRGLKIGNHTHTQTTSVSLSLCNIQFTEEKFIEKCACRNSHTSKKKLFTLARAIKKLEKQNGAKFSDDDFERVFSKWFKASRGYLRPGQTRAEYFDEFLSAYDCARRPLGENALAIAWQNSQNAPLPEAATKFKSQKIRALVRLCFELQHMAGDEPFYLSCRKAAELLNVSHVHAARFLNLLVREKLMSVIESGSAKTNRASRYQFAAKPKQTPLVVEQPRITFPDFRN